MATKKSEATTETKDRIINKLSTDKIEKLAKQIWLAGLGAYGRSFDEIQNRYEKMNSESQKLFDELVARGEKLQADAEEKLQDGKSDLERRIEKLKNYATLPVNSQLSDQLSEVNRKLDSLNKDLKKR